MSYLDDRTPDQIVEGAPAKTGDTYQPAFMTIDAQGNVSFDFTGHVKAIGLDIPTVQSPDPVAAHEVRFIDYDATNDTPGVRKGVLADLYGYGKGPSPSTGDTFRGNLLLRANTSSTNGDSQADIFVRSQDRQDNNSWAQLHTRNTPLNVAPQAQRTVEGAVRDQDSHVGGQWYTRTIIDSLKRSGFPQLSGASVPRQLFISAVQTINVAGLAAGAFVLVNGPLMSVIDGDGPLATCISVGIGLGFLGAIPNYESNAAIVNTATQFQEQFVFGNPYGVASSAGQFIYISFTDREVI